MSIDITDELKDLLKVYTDAEEHLKSKESSELQLLENYMKKYLEAKDKRFQVSQKLDTLKHKIAVGQSLQQENCDCDEDQDDE